MLKDNQNMTYFRELTPNERMAAIAASSPIALAVEVIGQIDIGSLRRAAENIGVACPTLNSRILFNSKGNLCFVPLSGSFALSVIESRIGAVELIKGELAMQFEASSGPLARAMLIIGDNRNELAIIAHPAAIDASGVCSIMALMINALSGNHSFNAPKSYFWLDRQNLKTLLAPDTMKAASLTAKALFNQIGNIAKQAYDMPLARPCEMEGAMETHFASFELSSSDTASLTALAQEKKVSEESITIMSFLKSAISSGWELSPKISVEKDMREYFGSQAMNLIGSLTFDGSLVFKYDFNDTFWANIQCFDNMTSNPSFSRSQAERVYFESINNFDKAVALGIEREQNKGEIESSISYIKTIIPNEVNEISVKPVLYLASGTPKDSLKFSVIKIGGILYYSIQVFSQEVSEKMKKFVDDTAVLFSSYITNDIFYSCVNTVKEAPRIVNGLDSDVAYLME